MEVKNEVEIEERNGVTKIKLNGVNLKKVLDYKLEEKPGEIEMIIKISIDNLKVSTDINWIILNPVVY